ncbi:MAG: MaoC family dehydratase [Deltaproteobacteria bacterium]|nr:MaoC family dehydratase [Deltaproteobacteria bacterium]
MVQTKIALGKSYEELEIGDEASFSKTIGECDIYQFAGISGDFNPVHLNEEYARQTRFEKRVAHGVLSMSLAGSILGMVLPGIGTILVEINTRFKRPVFIGDTITAVAKVAEKLEEKKWVRMQVEWYNQRNEVVITGFFVVVPPRK